MKHRDWNQRIQAAMGLRSAGRLDIALDVLRILEAEARRAAKSATSTWHVCQTLQLMGQVLEEMGRLGDQRQVYQKIITEQESEFRYLCRSLANLYAEVALASPVAQGTRTRRLKRKAVLFADMVGENTRVILKVRRNLRDGGCGCDLFPL